MRCLDFTDPDGFDDLGQIAQMVEHTTENRGVGGSIPPLAISCGNARFVGLNHEEAQAEQADGPRARLVLFLHFGELAMSQELNANVAVDASLKPIGFSTGNPVFDGLVTIMASRNWLLDDKNIKAIHKSLMECALQEPGGLRRAQGHNLSAKPTGE